MPPKPALAPKRATTELKLVPEQPDSVWKENLSRQQERRKKAEEGFDEDEDEEISPERIKILLEESQKELLSILGNPQEETPGTGITEPDEELVRLRLKSIDRQLRIVEIEQGINKEDNVQAVLDLESDVDDEIDEESPIVTEESSDSVDIDALKTINISEIVNENDETGIMPAINDLPEELTQNTTEDTMIPQLSDFEKTIKALQTERTTIKAGLEKTKEALATAESELQALQGRIATLKSEKNTLAAKESEILKSANEARDLIDKLFE